MSAYMSCSHHTVLNYQLQCVLLFVRFLWDKYNEMEKNYSLSIWQDLKSRLEWCDVGHSVCGQEIEASVFV